MTEREIASNFDKICERISEGENLAKIAKELGFSRTHFYRVVDSKPENGDAYARARERLMESWSDSIDQIAADGSHDTIETDDGRQICNHEWIARSRLMVDTRKWLMSKLAPRKYGDKITQEISGKDGGPLVI